MLIDWLRPLSYSYCPVLWVQIRTLTTESSGSSEMVGGESPRGYNLLASIPRGYVPVRTLNDWELDHLWI